jgi:hypothetical protein
MTPTSQMERMSFKDGASGCLWAAQDSMTRRSPFGRACAIACCEQGSMDGGMCTASSIHIHTGRVQSAWRRSLTFSRPSCKLLTLFS